MNEVTRQLRCIILRAGIEIWVEMEKAANLISALKMGKGSGVFVEIDEQIINTSDIVGIFTPAYMEEKTRRKNGQWQCKINVWHDRGEKCDCDDFKWENGKKVAKFIIGEGWKK